MRVSLIEGDPAYMSARESATVLGGRKIFLDGVEQKYVIMIDTEAGEVIRFRHCNKIAGEPFQWHGNILERVSGIVTLEVTTDAAI